MANIVKLFLVVLIEALLMNNVIAQLNYQNLNSYLNQNAPYISQFKNVPYNQPQIINSLLSTPSMPLIDKLGAIASVIQKMPPKNPERIHKRLYMAEALKQTAIESLLNAANACKCARAENGFMSTPLPQPQVTVGNDAISQINRAANVRCDRYV